MKKIYKSDLVNQIVEKNGLNKKEAKQVIDNVFDFIKSNVLEGNKVIVHGFGTFYQREVKEREFNSSLVGSVVKIKGGKKIALKSKAQ